MELMQNWDKTRQRFEAFWQGEMVDRCMVAVSAPKNGGKYRHFEYPKTGAEKEKYYYDGEQVLERALDWLENTYLAGDAMPQIGIGMPACGHAGFFKGCRFHHTQTTVWFETCIHNIEQDKLVFDADSFLYRKTVALAKYLANECNGRYFIPTPDACGNTDALAHLRGSENLLMDMLEEREWVHKALAKVNDAWKKYHGELFPLLLDNNHGGTSIGWLNTWAPDKHGQLESDISVMMSPPMFDEFILPELIDQSDFLDYPLYHFDGIEQIRFIDSLLSVEKLRCIQWTHCDGQPSPLEYIPILKRMQSAGKSLVIHTYNEVIMEGLLEALSSKGLLLIMYAKTEDEAKAIVKKAERLSHE